MLRLSGVLLTLCCLLSMAGLQEGKLQLSLCVSNYQLCVSIFPLSKILLLIHCLEPRLTVSEGLLFWLLIMKDKQICMDIYLLLRFVHLKPSLEHAGKMQSHNVS